MWAATKHNIPVGQVGSQQIPTYVNYRVRHKDLPIENVTLLKNDLVFEDAFNI